MRRVYKYDLPIEDFVELQLPTTAIILKIDTQNEEPKIWAWVNPDEPLVTRKFRIAGTGHDINEPFIRYIETFFIRNLVFHVFELD
jgi:hypothetical protein